jgi:oxygen-dependent protoporphyrinogen oxidase
LRVAIVGGGISGLALGERLAAEGADPVVLEAADAPGGKVRTERSGGFLLEAGPNGFLDREPATRELAARVGLQDALRPAAAEAERRWIFLRGRLRQVPARPPELLRTDLLPLSAKLRMALEVLTPRAPRGKDESIAEFGRRHVGARATRDLLGAMVVGIFAGDVEQLSLQSCFPRMVRLEAEHRSLVLAMKRLGRGGAPAGKLTTTEGGLSSYVDAVARRLGERVHTGAPVQRVRRGPEGFVLSLAGGELRADAVVITTPADAAAALLGPLDPALGELARSVPYAPVSVVHVAYPRSSVAHPLDGFGYLAPPHEHRPVLGVLFISSIFPFRAPPGHALFTVMVGGALRPAQAALPDAELLQVVRTELEQNVGASGEPSLTRVVRWDRAIPQYLVGHARKVEELDARLAAHAGLFVGGNAWRGVGFNDCIAAAAPLAASVLARPG